MKLFKISLRICLQNIRKWTTDYRIWIIGIIVALLIHQSVYQLVDISENLGIKSSLWIYPFLYTQYYAKLIFTLPIVMIFCNAPFIDRNQTFVIVRAGRKKWTLGQILYIFFTSAIYYLFIIVVSVLFSLPNSELNFEWGKLISTVSLTDISSKMGYNFLFIDPFVSTYFTPLQAIFFTFLLSWLGGVMIGLVIYFFNIITKTKYLGAIIGSILIIFSFYIDSNMTGKTALLKFSPMSWTTLNHIDVGGITEQPHFDYCIFMYSLICIFFIILIFLASKKIDINEDEGG